MPARKRRKSAWDRSPGRVATAEAVLRESRRLLRDPGRVLAMLAEGRPVRLPLRTDLGVMASLFEAIHRGDYDAAPIRPDTGALRELLLFCRSETDLLTAPEAPTFAEALLALSAHHRDWVRPLRDWRRPSHNVRRQFHSLVRHLIARYDVPTFLDAAWLGGLTIESVREQGWYKLIGSGRNIRTAPDLPFPMTKKQAHHFLRAPDDFDIPSAFRWAVIVDLGGDERLVRSIRATRLATSFEAPEFWTSVFRFFIANPMLDPAHHGPIVDFLHHQKFEPSVSDPRRGETGQPDFVPAQPHLSMKGRTAESMLRSLREWHRSLARAPAILTPARGVHRDSRASNGRTARARTFASTGSSNCSTPTISSRRGGRCGIASPRIPAHALGPDVDLVAAEVDRERAGDPAVNDRGQQPAADHRAGARAMQPAPHRRRTGPPRGLGRRRRTALAYWMSA